MKKYTVILLCFFTIIKIYSQELYYRATIQFDSEHTIKKLAKLGLEVDHGSISKYNITNDYSAKEIALAKQNGFKVKIIISDVTKHYQEQNNINTAKKSGIAANNCTNTSVVTSKYTTPINFSLGSMGGYFTYAEMLANLDSMASKFPNLIKARAAIDTFHTIEGRPIYWLKISDNPTVNELEPEVLYTSLHHAREPNSLSQQIMYMWYLLENYATSTEIQYLVNNNELYFIPCLNPDGYIYNFTTNPAGGGLWRKNRKNNGTDFGVDLNRNYGLAWGYDNTGSSPTTSSETYRGTAGFSEPETQAIQWFCNNHTFDIALNYHTYGNLLIYPWGYLPSFYTPDSALFVNYAKFLTEDNNFKYGTGDQTVNYTVNGDSDDWMYGEQISKPKILALTPEAGDAADGFWPAQNKIIDICKSNISQNLNTVRILNKYYLVENLSIEKLTTPTLYFKYNIKRLGLRSTPSATVSIMPISTAITSVGSNKTYTSMNLLDAFTDSILITIDTSLLADNDRVKLLIQNNNSEFTFTDTLIFVYDKNRIILSSNNCNALSPYWIKSTGSSWGTTTTTFVSAGASITDSPLGNYLANTISYLTTIPSFNLVSTLVSATVKYKAKWYIENNYDYVSFEIKPNATSPWISLCAPNMNKGVIDQDSSIYLYDDFNNNWTNEEIDITPYIGNSAVKFRFKFVSDSGVEEDGFYLDDFNIETKSSVVTSILQNEKNNNISIIPNPSETGIFNIYGNNLKSIIIYTISGKKILEKYYDLKTINLSMFDNGMYLLQLNDDNNNIINKKIIVNK